MLKKAYFWNGSTILQLVVDIPNLDDNSFCSLLLYGSAEFSYIINRMILEATIKYIKSSKRFDRVDYET